MNRLEHEFGGPWTAKKLETVKKYLSAYTTIFKNNLRAQYFQTIYVDAFAGTGYSKLKKQSYFFTMLCCWQPKRIATCCKHCSRYYF